MNFSSIFKKKRAYSPDSIGIANYKRQRLIEDFENLRLVENHPTVSKSNKFTVPTAVKITTSNILKKTRSSDYGDKFYLKIREQLLIEKLQVINWIDQRIMVYKIWVQWFNQNFNRYISLNGFSTLDQFNNIWNPADLVQGDRLNDGDEMIDSEDDAIME